MMRLICAVCGVALLAAVVPLWPYGYYMLLRVVVFAGSLYAAYSFWTLHRFTRGFAIPFVIAALVFNPFFPATVDRAVWTVLNIVAGLYFLSMARSYPNMVRVVERNTPPDA